jgi:predicted small metal-binding protein
VPVTTVKAKCKGCGVEFAADDEQALIDKVQAHIAEAHARGHTPTREQVLSVIRAQREAERR